MIWPLFFLHNNSCSSKSKLVEHTIILYKNICSLKYVVGENYSNEYYRWLKFGRLKLRAAKIMGATATSAQILADKVNSPSLLLTYSYPSYYSVTPGLVLESINFTQIYTKDGGQGTCDNFWFFRFADHYLIVSLPFRVRPLSVLPVHDRYALPYTSV